MCHKTLDLIWGIWGFIGQKFLKLWWQEIWPFGRVTKNTFIDEPWWWAHFTGQNLIVLRNCLFEKTLFWKPVLICKTILLKNWSFEKTVLLKNNSVEKQFFKNMFFTKTAVFAVNSESLQFLLWYRIWDFGWFESDG